MPGTGIDGMRALVLGAETAAGRVLAGALVRAGARVAAVAASTDAEAAFATQRLSRRIGAATSQAIDASNEMAVRVMTRQVSKALGGLDLLLFCAELGGATGSAAALACRFAAREMKRAGGGAIALAAAEARPDVEALTRQYGSQGIHVLEIEVPPAPDEAWARDILRRLAE